MGAGNESTVCQWESGAHVPQGVCRERLLDLLDGRLWPDIRRAAVAGAGMPERWKQVVRWYRWVSQLPSQREAVGRVAAVVLDHLGEIETTEGLRAYYSGSDGSWVQGLVAERRPDRSELSGLGRVEEVAYGLRWLELTSGLRVDLARSLRRQLPRALLK